METRGTGVLVGLRGVRELWGQGGVMGLCGAEVRDLG